jgi:hypothetical protein
MNDARLFNCCANNSAPDWTPFDALETGGCTTETDPTTGESWTNGGIDDADAEFWTVYARLREGGCEAITDCASRTEVDAVAEELSRLSGLPVV